MLLERGADINAKNGIRGPALFEAIAHRKPRVIQLLLDKGAGIHAKNVGKLVKLDGNFDDITVAKGLYYHTLQTGIVGDPLHEEELLWRGHVESFGDMLVEASLLGINIRKGFK